MKRALAALPLLVMLASACTIPAKTTDPMIRFGDGSAIVHAPAHQTGAGVIVLHSYQNTAAEPVAQGWSTLADRKGFVAVYPARGAGWDAGLCCGAAATSGRDDVAWLMTVIDTVKVRYHLTRILIAGNSNGGMMAERLVAEQPQVTDRIAVWGAAPEMPTSGYWTGYAALYDGATDATVPWQGGLLGLPGPAVIIRPSATVPQWLIGAHVRQIVVAGAGHQPAPGWPGMAWFELTR